LRRGVLLSALALAFAWLTLSPQARAACQQGCDLTHANTFLGDEALNKNTFGVDNTAIGNSALFSNTTGDSNTATVFTRSIATKPAPKTRPTVL
jgi:hypothetical protein